MYSSPRIIWVIKSRRTKLARHVTRIRGMKYAYRILVEKSQRRRNLIILLALAYSNEGSVSANSGKFFGHL
jgi:hypothetical protein